MTIRLLLATTLLLLSLGVLLPSTANAQEPGAAQGAQGKALFDFHCATCHGLQGGGIAEALRRFPLPEQNCWQSKCHTFNHPPEGFIFPKYVPPLFNRGALSRFTSAQDVFDFVTTNMPFQDPGRLSTEEYWAVVSYILNRRDLPLNQTLDNQTAAGILLHIDRTPKPPASTTWGWVLVIGISLPLAGAGAMVAYRMLVPQRT